MDLALARRLIEGDAEHSNRALEFEPDDPEANEELGLVSLTSGSTGETLVLSKLAVQSFAAVGTNLCG